jgi:poly(A) polymerase
VDVLRCAKEICQELAQAGFTAYFAGGWVRDYILRTPSDDIDIATNALPEEITSIFPDHVLVGAQFGVVLVLFGNYQFEIATFRQDMHYANGRKPAAITLKSTPEEDAKRRDFTINGIFYDPASASILDFVGGQEDLQKKIVRTIGDPNERFGEDRLRMLRAIRFAFRFGFTIEENTYQAIQKNAHLLLPAVSLERVWQELSKMREGKNFKDALLKLHETGLLGTIFTPLKNISHEEIKKRLEGIENLSPHVPLILILARLFPGHHDYLLQLSDYLRTAKEEGKWVESYLQVVDKNFYALELYEACQLLANPRFRVIFEVLLSDKSEDEKKKAKNWYEHIEQTAGFFIELMRKKEMLVRAVDLQQAGCRPGKELGLLLKEAEKIAITKHLVTKEHVLEELKKTPLFMQYTQRLT